MVERIAFVLISVSFFLRGRFDNRPENDEESIERTATARTIIPVLMGKKF